MPPIKRFASRRPGFTFVELLVVVTIVAVGLAVALPAVQRAREADRLARCKGNLRQLGLALHSYHETHRRFPYSSSYSVTGEHRPGAGHTWNEFLLPYMNMSATYLELDFNVPNTAASNVKVLEKLKMSWQCCPSNAFSEKMRVLSGIPFYGWEVDTQGEFYAPCTGTQGGAALRGYDCEALGLEAGSYCYTRGSEWNSPDPAANPGMFGGRNAYSAALRDVTDGAASTFMVGERRAELLTYSGA